LEDMGLAAVKINVDLKYIGYKGLDFLLSGWG
jgi:hypothetical protein